MEMDTEYATYIDGVPTEDSKILTADDDLLPFPLGIGLEDRYDVIGAHFRFSPKEPLAVPLSTGDAKRWIALETERDVCALAAECGAIRDALCYHKYPVAIDDWQEVWLKQCFEIVKKYRWVQDTSPPGSGKSHIGNQLGVMLGLPMVVFAPKDCLSVWYGKDQSEGDFIGIYSFDELKGSRTRSHPLLNRIDTDETKQIQLANGTTEDRKYHTVTYTATKEFKQLVTSGCLFIFDEYQKLKNKSARSTAGWKALNIIMTTPGTQSYVYMSSATPFDQYHQISALMSALDLYHRNTKGRDAIRAMNARFVRQISLYIGRSVGTPTSLLNSTRLYAWYRECIFPAVTGGCVAPELKVHLDIANLFTKLRKEDAARYKEGVKLLTDAHIDTTQERMTAIWKGIQIIEAVMAPYAVRIGKERLYRPGERLIFFCHYKHTYETLMEGFSSEQPAILTGATPQKKRLEILRRFQEGKIRVVIANMRIASTGINLHDTTGKHPRSVILFPCYSLIDMHQASLRTHRTGSQSDSWVRILHCQQHPADRVLQLLQQKTQCVNNLVAEATRTLKELPADHDDWSA